MTVQCDVQEDGGIPLHSSRTRISLGLAHDMNKTTPISLGFNKISETRNGQEGIGMRNRVWPWDSFQVISLVVCHHKWVNRLYNHLS